MRVHSQGTLCALAFVTLFSIGCKKTTTGTGGPGSSTPTPTPVASATPTPVPTPTPIAQDNDCVPSIPDAPVLPVRNAPCPQGFVGHTYWDGQHLCVPKSSCESANHENFRCLPGDYPEIDSDCHPLIESLKYNAKSKYLPIDPRTGLFDDAEHGMYDAFGRRVTNGRVDRDWHWTGSCAPKVCNQPVAQRKCVNPVPPPVARFEITSRGQQSGKVWLMDATPIVCDGPPGSPTADYCSKVWKGQKTGCCPVRPDDDPLREECDYEITGTNPLNGDRGPVWNFTYGADYTPYNGNQFSALVNHFDFNYRTKGYVCSNRMGAQPGVCTEFQVLGQW